MLTSSQDERIPSAGTLEPRYRRVLSFGDVLEESIRLFRQHWVTFALVSAVSLIPPGLLAVWATASGSFGSTLTLTDIRAGRFAQAPAANPEVGVLIASGALGALFYCLWSAAVTATTEAYLRGGEPTLARVYRRAARRFLSVFLSTLLYALGLSVLSAVSFVLLFFTVFPGLGGIVPLIGLIVWWLNPGARKGWLKWLIIVCSPFALLVYFATRWSMYVAAAVVERLGPLASLRRSSELIDRHVFRVLATLVVSGLIVSVLTYGPVALISIPLTLTSGLVDNGSATEAIVTQAARVVLQILFSSIGVVVYTLIFIDLRNRREGTDMAERLTQLEVSPTTTGG